MSQTKTKIEISGMAALPIHSVNWGKVPYDNGTYTVKRISETRGLYRLILAPVTQTGANVTTQFELPVDCNIEKMGWTHTNSTGATLSADALTMTVDLYTRGSAYSPVRLFSYTGTASNDIEAYGFTEPQGMQVLVTTNTTATDKMLIYFDVTVQGDPQ
jgi:hypothetical protein